MKHKCKLCGKEFNGVLWSFDRVQGCKACADESFRRLVKEEISN